MAKAATIQEILKKDPEKLTWIDVPESQIIKETKDFGSAELLSGVVTIIATFFATGVVTNPFLMSLVGPVIEKVGFFIWEFIKAVKERMRNRKKALKALFKDGLRGGTTNLIVDVLAHDPLYIIIMTLLLAFTNIEPVYAAAVSFLAAIPLASAAKTGGEEFLHGVLRFFSKMRFKWESYFETRFLVLEGVDANKVFDDFSKAFRLSHYNKSSYHDVYYRHSLPLFGSRLGLVRNRNVEDLSGTEHSFRNVEFSYTLGKKRTFPGSEFNLFYAHKEKGKAYIRGPGKLPWIVRRFIKRRVRVIDFTREIRYDKEIRIVLDTVKAGRKRFHIMEIKSYHESKEFFRAMQYLLRHGSVMTTTFSKYWIMKRLKKGGV